MSIGETRTALDAILWEELPLAQDVAAGVSSICADLRSNNIASLFGKTRREELSLRATVLRGEVLVVGRK